MPLNKNWPKVGKIIVEIRVIINGDSGKLSFSLNLIKKWIKMIIKIKLTIKENFIKLSPEEKIDKKIRINCQRG